jgi:hypothetical protein
MMPDRRPLNFTPMKGLMSIARTLTHQFGLGEMWAGEDWIEGVMRDKFSELGVPSEAVSLTGPQASMTPRQIAEEGGFIRRKRPHRRVK